MYENIVLIAAGGGNDVFSTLAYAKCMLNETNNIAIISLLGLTPFHSINNSNIELPLIIPDDKMERYILCNPPKKIRCIERLLPSVLSNICPNINKYACLSTKYSPLSQSKTLIRQLIKWNMLYNNTSIMIVDFGGDILSDGRQSSIISPELDAFSLSLGNFLIAEGYETRLTVCFPGVDGELSREYLTDICTTKSIETISINTDQWKYYLLHIYAYISSERPGNTIPNMLYILDNPNCEEIYLKKHWQVGKLKVQSNLKIAINHKLQSYVYIFNIIDLVKWNPYINIFDMSDYNLLTVFENLVNIYANYGGLSSDFYLQYLRKDSNQSWTNKELINSSDIMLINKFPASLTDDDIALINRELSYINAILFVNPIFSNNSYTITN